MRYSIAIIACALAAGCSSKPEYKVQGKVLDVADTIYQYKPTGYFCNGLYMGQLLVQFGDFSPFCPIEPHYLGPDPTLGRYELDIVMSTGGVPDFRLHGFTLNAGTTCDGGGGPAVATFLHFPPNPTNMNPQTPDMTVVAKGGTIKITQFDTANQKPLDGDFDLDFGDPSHLKGSFSAKNCNM
jgi:hypothetical protein